MQKTNLKGLTRGQLADFALSIGEKKYRGKQLFDWLYTKEAGSFADMTSLSKQLRETLGARARIDALVQNEASRSAHDGTTKFLFELADGKRIETVLIPPRTAFVSGSPDDGQRRLTVCVSTQVGCPLDCRFCATASMGFLRNLTAGEIVDQVLQVKRAAERRITNVVFMGMGEPLMNYEQVVNAVEILSTGLKIAARHITISTAGWVPGIRRLADDECGAKLAVSLHSLDNSVRAGLMPVAKKYPLDALIDAVRYYYRATKTRVTFEYILFDRRNDRDEDLERLVRLSRQVPCKVNIIPFHSISFTGAEGAAELRPTPRPRMDDFIRGLRDANVTVFTRSSSGEDIFAACGQLAVAKPTSTPINHAVHA